MCGVIGVWGSEKASMEVYQGLLLLQHRGQDAAGIVVEDKDSGRFRLRKAMGQVSDAISLADLMELPGQTALGHTRYSTIGDVKTDDIQPLAMSASVSLAAVHNGNLSNEQALRQKLRGEGKFLMTDNDLELLLYLVSEELNQNDNFHHLCHAVEKTMSQAQGGYSTIMLWGGRGIFAFKDPHGLRPLCYGKKGNSYAFASEASALSFLGYSFERELEPGEIIWIDESGKFHQKVIMNRGKRSCFFEWVYFAGAESKIDHLGVYEARLNLGIKLAQKIKNQDSLPMIDIVAPVPDTSRPAAAAIAEILKIPFREVLLKNRYVQRSFIMNGQEKRQNAVGLKFSVVEDQVRGKNVLLVDDSIVRGTTSRRLVELLKANGAKSIIFASTSPPIKYPCKFGIDFPNPKDLIAYEKSIEEVKQELGCEGLIYADIDDLKEGLKSTQLCTACLDANYPYPVEIQG